MKDFSLQIRLINQALAAAQASIELSKTLLADISGISAPATASHSSVKIQPPTAASLPGVMGTFDGESMVTASGEKFLVPPNYASKTLLVYGDKLKMVDAASTGEGGILSSENKKLFKQIERVKRQTVEGILSQKGKEWCLVTSDGSHKVLEAAVNHFGFKEGDHLVGILPQDNLKAPFAALEGLVKKIEDNKAPTAAVQSNPSTEIKDKKEAVTKVPKVEKLEKPVIKAKSRPTLKKEPLAKKPDMTEVKKEDKGDVAIPKNPEPVISGEDLR